MRPRRLAYIVDWLPPDAGAIGQYALAEAESRARQGELVDLFGLSSTASSVEGREFGAGKVRVHRLRAAQPDRSDFKKRAVWTLSTNLRLVTHALPSIFEADEVLITASPPFLEHLLVPLTRALRKRLVFRLADLHPECLMQELAQVPAWLHAFHALTVRMRKGADLVEVLGEDQRRRVLESGADARRVVLRRSGSPVSFDGGVRPLERPLALRGRSVLLYSGAVGHAHEIDTFVEGYAEHHAGESLEKVILWLNATGARASEFEAALDARGLPYHRTEGVALSDLAALLRTADAHLITLRDEYVGLVVPSKVYACIASGRPVLYVGSASSDVHTLCSEGLPEQDYWRAGVGDSSAVRRALDAIALLASPG